MKKSIELCKVRPGERFTLDGVEFVKLDEDLEAAFVVTADTLPNCCPFEDEDAEREDHLDIFKAIVERPIDLTSMDGMTDYGKPYTVARILTIDEFRKYRRHIPLTGKAFWTATPWNTLRSPYSFTYRAYYIDTSGAVHSGYVYGAYFAPRPALYLQSSILASIETDEEPQKGIRDYTGTELMDELYRRMNYFQKGVDEG